MLKTKDDLILAILHEIEIQQNYLGPEKINTLYFGGGTPSMLGIEDLQLIIDKISRCFDLAPDAEMTIEANPDDLHPSKLAEIKAAGYNRLSIGIQSFDDRLLKFYHRAHNAEMAVSSVRNAQKMGLENISIDLIFGAPNQSLLSLADDLKKALDLGTPHISIYGLTIEEKTAFGKWHKKGSLIPLEEEIAAQHFEMIMRELKEAGFHQYEISNFAKPGFESRHNSAYWQGKGYLGLGPSAHSYNGHSRQYNVSNNPAYIKALGRGQIPAEIEVLTREDKINERILIQMRTHQGLDLSQLKNDLSFDLAHAKKEEIDNLLHSNMVRVEDDFLQFTDPGKLLADFIIEKLII